MASRPLSKHPGISATVACALVAMLGTALLSAGAAGASPKTGYVAHLAKHAPMIVHKGVATHGEVVAAAPVATAGDALGAWESAMATAYPNTYGGLYVNAAGNFVVPTVGAASALRQFARDHFPSAALQFGGGTTARSTALATTSQTVASASVLTFGSTSTSFDDLVALKADILANPDLSAAGVIGAGIDVANDAVSVTTSGGPVDAALEAAYGSEVEVTDASGTTLDASRTNDTPPWNGGDMLLTTSGTLCSLGFGVHDTSTGTTYQLSAGHCGSNTWYNLPRDGTSFTESHLVGSTVSGSRMTSGIDAQLIASNSSCISWGANDSRYFITGYSNAPQGASILTEGSVGGSIPGTVQVADWSGKFGSENLSNVDLTSAVTSLGDSGGPVVYPSYFGPLAAGSVIGVITYPDGSQLGAIQNIDAELYDYSAFTGDTIVPNTSPNGTNC